MDNDKLKKAVQDYWNEKPCGTGVTEDAKYTKKYFDDIEIYRYSVEPEIFSFAQFTRFHGKKILEVGVGAGTNFLQWVRAGTKAYGIDLTREGIGHTSHRLDIYGLKAEELKVADCENLPYGDNMFDVVYSWSVIHHTPNTYQALREIVRVCCEGGTCKIMVYNRYSLFALLLWIKKALLKGKPWKTISWCLYHYLESIGTRAFTKKEVLKMLQDLRVDNIQIKAILTYYDKLENHNKLLRFTARILATILGPDRSGFFMTVEFSKANPY